MTKRIASPAFMSLKAWASSSRRVVPYHHPSEIEAALERVAGRARVPSAGAGGCSA